MHMTAEEALAKLDEVRAAMNDQFDDEHGTHQVRLHALGAALDTATMHVGHLHDEEDREQELAQRIAKRARVHGNDEVVSPVNRAHEHTLAIAGRAS
jgi:hypothetical protein